jgi:hypothetical protein
MTLKWSTTVAALAALAIGYGGYRAGYNAASKRHAGALAGRSNALVEANRPGDAALLVTNMPDMPESSMKRSSLARQLASEWIELDQAGAIAWRKARASRRHTKSRA